MPPIQDRSTRYVGWRGKALRREVVVVLLAALAFLVGGGIWSMLDSNAPSQVGMNGPPTINIPKAQNAPAPN